MDRRIRRVVHARQRQIKLLEEYRQALIHQAVTGQIDVRTGKPYPAYKDSGVTWLGKVPEHWEVLPGRAVFREINDRGHPDEQMLSVTITRGVLRQQDLLADSSKKDSSNEDKSNYKLVQPGDLVYNKMRAWQGAVGVSGYRGIVSPAYIVQRLRSAENLPRYMHFLLRTPLFASEAERWSYGITSDQWSLRAEEFKCIYFSLPPLPEQTAIVDYLDAQTAKIDTAIATLRREIELLREYRERLIADVVTGKVDVREVAAQLPEEPPEEESEWIDTEDMAEGEETDEDSGAEALAE
jgi:type I restriction enzyme S subunit